MFHYQQRTNYQGGTFTFVSGTTGGSVSGNSLSFTTPGTYTVSYSIGDASSCGAVPCSNASNDDCFATDQATITIFNQPDPDIDFQEGVCWNGFTTTLPISVLSPMYPASGGVVAGSFTSSATGVATVTGTAAGGTITIVGSGSTTITYTEVNDDDASCTATVSKVLMIEETTDASDPSWTAIGPFCVSDGTAVDLDALVTGTTDGVFTGTGVAGTKPNYTFTPATAAVGTHTICYTVNSSLGCSAIECKDVEVFEAQTIALNDVQVECSISASGNIDLNSLVNATGTTDNAYNGTWALTANPNAILTSSSLAYSGPGCFEVTYTPPTTGLATCDAAAVTAFVNVSQQPQPSFDIQVGYCFDQDAATNLLAPTLNSPTYTGVVTRTWSVESGPATINNATTGEIDITGTGTVQLRLTESMANPACGSFAAATCEATFEVNIDVQNGATLNAEFTGLTSPICAGESRTLTATTNGGAFAGLPAANLSKLHC